MHTPETSKRELEKRKNRRLEWLSSNGPCQCGATSNLELHHIDPTQKVSHKIWSWKATRRDEELKKCVAICNECHKKETSAFNSSKFRRPTKNGSLNWVSSARLPVRNLQSVL